MSLDRFRSSRGVSSPIRDDARDSPQKEPEQGRVESQINSVKVTAPCTSANLGPGFDVFGLALEAFHDTVHIRSMPSRRLELEIGGVDAKDVPSSVELNSAGLAAKHLLTRLGIQIGLRIHIEKGVPVGKGLGSSAASAAAAVVGLDHMLGLGLPKNEIIEIAAHGEVATAGAPHADNVAAAVLGGFALVQSYSPFSVLGFALPSGLEVAIAIPDVPAPRNKTEFARAVLPDRVPLGKVAQNVGGAASIVAGILSGDIAVIGKGMVDVIVEPARAQLLPGYDAVRRAALSAGAEGVAISGAGPSMIAVVEKAKASAVSVADAMRNAFESAGVRCVAVATRPAHGARILVE